jgi:hypothetical protein
MLRLHTGPQNPRAMQSATSGANAEGQNSEKPLTVETIKTMLRYLVPPSGTEIPSLLLSEQLRRRHHFLSIPPSNLASYLCLNPDHPSQDTNYVLSTLRALPGQHSEQLIGRVTYSSDGEELTAHVILGEAEERAIQICFGWEVETETGEGAWRYLDIKPLPLPDVVGTLQEAQEVRAKARSAGPLATNGVQAVSDDSYWSLYDNAAPADGRPRLGISPTGSGYNLSPRREEAYWDRYGYGDDDDEEEDGGQPLAAPISNNRPDLKISNPLSNQFVPTEVWTGTSSRFNAEDLSEALAMHLQPDLAHSSDIAQGLSLNINTPPPAAPSYTSIIDLASPVSDRVHALEGSGMRANGDARMNGKNGTVSSNDKAVSEAVRGVFQLWRNLRQAQGKEGMSPIEEKDTFLSLVAQSLLGL